MEIKLCSLIALLGFLTIANAQTVFDITKCGATPNSDITAFQILTKTWTDACASPTGATIVIPAGTYKCGVVEFKGPCKGPITFQVDGTLQAPTSPDGDSWITFCSFENLAVTGTGTFDGMGSAIYGKQKSKAVNLRFNFITNGHMEGVTSKDSKEFHVNVLGCKNLTISKFTVCAPADSPNTDGIHLGRSNGVQILDTKIGTGDDCISVGDGMEQLTVERVTCGPGHGISIGSLGQYAGEMPVKGIFVRNCTLVNTQNGVRIKSWPDQEANDVSDIHFEDIVLDNVDNPIIVDQMYCPSNLCKSKGASKVTISNVSFKNIRGTCKLPEAITMTCSSAHPCTNVEMCDIDIKCTTGPAKAVCTNVKPVITGIMNPPGC
ncbi:unnamed protein product [Linum tenue]|uniref:Polygalacturonase n=1 Tax=Linum tenue TaxID=586396 RepID=A0AAV0GSM3_9ROSI|nr:unnamed protein product [Linum tenue]